MGIALFYGAVLIVQAISIVPSIADVATAEKIPTDQLALVNFGAPGGLLSHLATSTQIVGGTGDKLDFTGDHFFGRDQEKHEYNRQAHVNLEHVRYQDPHLRRFLGKAIVKRQGPYPPRVDPPTHYGPPLPPPTTTTTEPPTTTTSTTTTTTTTTPPPPPPPTLPTVEIVTQPEVFVPHEEYGVPPAYPPVYGLPSSEQSLYAVDQIVGGFGSSGSLISDVSVGTTGTGCTDCTFSVLPPLPALVYPSLPPVVVPQPQTPPAPGDQSVGQVVGGASVTDGSGGATGTGCTDCTFSSLPSLPALVYPSLPPVAVPEPVPVAVPQTPEDNLWTERGPEPTSEGGSSTTAECVDCPPTVQLPPLLPPLPSNTGPASFAAASIISVPAQHLAEEPLAVHREDDLSGSVIRSPGSDCAPVPAVDLRLERPRQQTAPVLSTQSQVFLVQGKEPYPVLKAKQGRRSLTNVRRGSYKFIHTAKQRNNGWREDEDSVIVPSSEQQTGEINQIVVCTVDCYALEEKIQPPPQPPVEIPSDGRLW